MSMLLTLAAAYAICRLLPRIVAELIATFIGTLLAFRSGRAREALLASSPTSTLVTAWDYRPNGAQRRALRRSLEASLDATVFTSLLPHVSVRGYKLANGLDHLSRVAGHGLTRLRATGLDPVQRG